MWSLLRDRLLWKGLLGLVVLGLIGYGTINYWLMPSYTRHGVSIAVPDAKNLPYDQAVRVLERRGLQPERGSGPYDPSLPRDVVVEQTPNAHQQVKPGRRIYLTVNSGETPRLRMPNLENLSRRQAVNQIEAHQLRVGQVRVDPIPSPYENTVTRQRPAPGDTIQHGTEVNLWISPGQGESFVDVPDVRGIPFPQADSLLLLRHHLRSVLVNDTSGLGGEEGLRVTEQRPRPGTSVREGTEIRVTVGPGAPRADLDSVRTVLDSIAAARDSIGASRANTAAGDSISVGYDSLRTDSVGTRPPGSIQGGGRDAADTSGAREAGPPPAEEEIPRQF